MMNIAPILVDLPKAGHFVRDLTFRSPKPVGVVLHTFPAHALKVERRRRSWLRGHVRFGCGHVGGLNRSPLYPSKHVFSARN